MAGFTNYAERTLLDFVLSGTGFTVRTAATACAAAFTGTLKWSVALFTAEPTENGVVSEVSTSGTGYARQLITASTMWNSAATANDTTSKVLAVDIPFSTSTAAWGTVTHWGIYDENGNLWGSFLLSTATAIASGVTTPTLRLGEHTATLD